MEKRHALPMTMKRSRPQREPRDFLRKVERTIRKYGLLTRGDKVLVAVSGGADSTGMLAVLMELRPTFSLHLALAHFNHKLRRSADADEEFVIRLAQEFTLPLYLGRENIRAYARKRGQNLEEAGRERRYEFLRKTASKIGAARIATGHTVTDQAETFLMRLLRGSGPQGLGGISPALAGLIIRPLIEVERGEVEAFLRSKKMAHRTDESNLDRRFLRNKIRLDLIPYLKKNYEPKIVAHLGRLADIIREEDDFLEKAAAKKVHTVVLEKEGKIFLEARLLDSLPPALARRVARSFLRQAKGDLRRISFADIEFIRRLGERSEVHLPGKLVLRREKGLIFPKEKPEPPALYDYAWDGKSELEIKELRLRFSAKVVPYLPNQALLFDDGRRACLHFAKLRFPLVVRSRHDGDRYRPCGAPGRKKLKEIMRAKGIPPSERDRHPVFLSGGDIVWALGLPVGEEFKVTPLTKKVLIIEKA